jgi:hypothetical protein
VEVGNLRADGIPQRADGIPQESLGGEVQADLARIGIIRKFLGPLAVKMPTRSQPQQHDRHDQAEGNVGDSPDKDWLIGRCGGRHELIAPVWGRAGQESFQTMRRAVSSAGEAVGGRASRLECRSNPYTTQRAAVTIFYGNPPPVSRVLNIARPSWPGVQFDALHKFIAH